MLSDYLRKKIGFLLHRKKAAAGTPVETGAGGSENTGFSSSLDENLRQMKVLLGTSSDIIFHRFRLEHEKPLDGFLVYVDGLINQSLLTESILLPLLLSGGSLGSHEKFNGSIRKLQQSVLCSSDSSVILEYTQAVEGCMSGDAVLFVDTFDEALIINARGWEKRGISEPQTEPVVRGPREGFTENLRTNTALLRRRIKNPQLRMLQLMTGQKTRTVICVAYLEGVADPAVIRTVTQRIGELRVDSILDSGYIEQYIEDAPFSLFSTVGNSEKPDVVAAKILEGRVAVLVDGSPFALTAPMLFTESFQTAEDYYVRTYYASFIRIIRYLSFFIAVFAPGIYIALTTFHQELIPTTLLLTIATAREGTPFPALVEAMVMTFSFEVLREAGLRLPRPVGQAISIVGALVIGEAAVSAGIVGAPMVITIAITAVAGFVVPGQTDSAALLRLISMVFAATLGVYGLTMLFLVMLIHLASLQSFGVPYFKGLSPSHNLQDTFIRMPLWSMVRRPAGIAKGDIERRDYFVPPPGGGQPEDKEGDTQ